MYNKIILVGNLTRDIEIRYTQGGLSIASTAIATSKKFKSQTGENKEEVCFVDITFFGNSAVIANQYLRKGSKVLVEGRLKLDQWTDKNGNKRSKHGVIVDSMQMLDSKKDREDFDNNDTRGDSQYETNKTDLNKENSKQEAVEFSFEDEEIPF